MVASDTPAPVAVAEPDEAAVEALLDELQVTPESNLIGVLQQVQERLAYLPGTALQGIARRMRIPLSRVYGVVTFYADFHLTPQGRHKVRVCRGTACHVNGGTQVLAAVQRLLDIEDGQTTADLNFTLETVACLGTCFLAPAMIIDDQYFGRLTPQRVERIIQSYQEASR